MLNKRCKRCDKALTQKQIWRHGKYCGRTCYMSARFGEKIDWNGVELRPGKALEVIKLCLSGMTEKAARQAAGASYKEMARLKNSPVFAAFLPARICLFCGELLLQKPLQRRYCSSKCQSKERYARRLAAEGRVRRQIDYEKRKQVIDLYELGLGRGSIAQHLGIPQEKAKSWIQRSGAKRPAEICPEIMMLRPLRHRLEEAQSAAEWAHILHEAAEPSDASGSIFLVCGTMHGSGAPGRYAGFVLEKLQQNFLDGRRFAFCNTLFIAPPIKHWTKLGEVFWRYPRRTTQLY